MIWKIAWGSLIRHGRRSFLIILVVAVSVAVMLFVTGMMDGMREDFFETMVSSGGHIQVDNAATADALDPFSLELLIDDWRDMEEWFRRQPETVRVEPILTFGAMVLSDDSNVPMVGHGVRPGTGFFSDVRTGIQEGAFLDDAVERSADAADTAAATGADAAAGPDDATDSETGGDEIRPGEILLSTVTADMLAVSVGDTVSVLVEDATGAPYYLAYEIRGVFRSDSPEFDQRSFLVSHRAAQDLLYLRDETRELRVVLADETAADAVAARFAAADAVGSSGGQIRVRTWREINGGMAVLLEMFDVFMYAINLLIVIVAATVITNAILMNVFEKIEEFGMMRAIGLTRKGQFALVIAEGTSYGVVGSLLGVAIGVPVVLWFSTHGIYFGEMMDAFGLGRVLTLRFDVGRTVVNAVFGAAVAVAGSLYAGLTAMRLSVIESIRGSA